MTTRPKWKVDTPSALCVGGTQPPAGRRGPDVPSPAPCSSSLHSPLSLPRALSPGGPGVADEDTHN